MLAPTQSATKIWGQDLDLSTINKLKTRHASTQSHAVAAALEVNRLEAISRKTEINNSLVAHEGEVKIKLHCRSTHISFVNL